MTDDNFDVQSLTTAEVAANGRRIRLNFIDTSARPASLTLPTNCVHQLIMTLPQLFSQALKAETADDSVRAVFPLDAWRLEQATESDVYIFSLTTPDGFEVAFSVSTQVFAEMALMFEHLRSSEERRLDGPVRPVKSSNLS